MATIIRSQDFTLTDAIRAHLLQRFTLALRRQQHIERQERRQLRLPQLGMRRAACTA